VQTPLSGPPDVPPLRDVFVTAVSVTSSNPIGPTMPIITGFIALLGVGPLKFNASIVAGNALDACLPLNSLIACSGLCFVPRGKSLSELHRAVPLPIYAGAASGDYYEKTAQCERNAAAPPADRMRHLFIRWPHNGAGLATTWRQREIYFPAFLADWARARRPLDPRVRFRGRLKRPFITTARRASKCNWFSSPPSLRTVAIFTAYFLELIFGLMVVFETFIHS
jgi:hypothetical protein